MRRAENPDQVELGVSLLAVALGVFVLLGSFSIELGAGYDRIGPRFFPYLVAAGLVLSGGALASQVARRGSAPGEHTSVKAVGTLVAALVASVLLLERAGFILTATLLFWLVARAFESRSPRRDAAVGGALSVAVYFAFTRGLGLSLPSGLLGGLF